MQNRKTVLILCGGKSEEHEISLISTQHVLKALDRNRFVPLLVGISREGVWHFFEDTNNFTLGGPKADTIRLNTQAPTVSIVPFLSQEKRAGVLVNGKRFDFDVAFPVLHGTQGEDGTMQGLFEIVGVPYVGANWGSSWICMDKSLTKAILKDHAVPVAEHVCLNRGENLASLRTQISKFGFPLFVKPARTGSSVGISKVSDLSKLDAAVSFAFQHDSKVLIEKGISGRELEVSVIGLNQSPRASLPGEIIPHEKIGFYSYEAKYLLDDGAKLVVPAKLTADETARIQALALKAYQLLECDGMARVDFFLETGSSKIYVNELNTIPGFTPISMYPKLWDVSGLNYQDLITELLRLAFERHKRLERT